MKDIVIKCACGTEFVFTVKDQEFYIANNFDRPKRCGNCRKAKKARYAEKESRLAVDAIMRGEKVTLN